MTDNIWQALNPAVRRMAIAMQHKLDANRHKSGWKLCSGKFLRRRLLEEISELFDECQDDTNSRATIRLEAADVCNFAMMITETWKPND